MSTGGSGNPSLKYRADIDGLRAVAVLLVLAYHVGIYRLRGGFVGVDVFFVISGFLIGSIIWSDLDASRFSLLAFYERRVRRIFPALVVVLIGTSVLAYEFLLPSELVAYGKSLLAATFSCSNIYFFHQSGYFDAPASMKPLLHTWSLGVEEQFYLFLPIFLIVVRKVQAQRQRIVVALVAAASFAASAYGAFRYPDAAFYLAFTRAWELLLGTLLAMDVVPGISSALGRNLASLSGLLMILASGFAYNAGTPFPGAAALLPCVGAALVIAAGRSGTSFFGRVLSLRPIVFIGMISYSLYLWHWPLIVFQQMNGMLVKGLSPDSTKLVLILVSVVIAALSWRFVEQPFRGRRSRLSRVAVFRLAAVTAAILVMLGGVILATGGIPSRYPAEAVKLASYEITGSATKAEYRVGTCFLTSEYSFRDFNADICLKQDPRKRNDLLIGDSHAAQLWYGLSSVFKNINLMQATASGCKPTVVQRRYVATCSRLMNFVFQDYLPKHHVDALLIGARWDDGDLGPLQQTLDWARHRGIPVVLFGPIVQYDSALPRLLAMAVQSNDPALPAAHRVAYYQTLDDDLSRLVRSDRGVGYVSYFKLLCPRESCVEYAGPGVPLQSDYGHLTGRGSLLVATRLRESGTLN